MIVVELLKPTPLI
ncbi:hypothetical protein LINPERPRIM_LOCUS6577 [Linum perenne]